MKVCNYLNNPVSCTGVQARIARSAMQYMEPVSSKPNRELLEELIRTGTSTFDKEESITLNTLYKLLPIGSERKLKNFDGQIKDSVYRGDNYMNRIVQSLAEPRLTFIRSMKNVGTNENPLMQTTAMSLRDPFRPEEVFVEFLEDSKDKLFLRVTREGFEAHKALYPSWEELTKDSVFQRVIKIMTGKDF